MKTGYVPLCYYVAKRNLGRRARREEIRTRAHEFSGEYLKISYMVLAAGLGLLSAGISLGATLGMVIIIPVQKDLSKHGIGIKRGSAILRNMQLACVVSGIFLGAAAEVALRYYVHTHPVPAAAKSRLFLRFVNSQKPTAPALRG